jgi:DNA-binding NarL/FixJ family response regulator
MPQRVFIYCEDGFTDSTVSASLSLLGFDVIGNTDNYEVALMQTAKLVPDVMLVHIEHNRTQGLELSKDLRFKFPNLGLVLMTKASDLRLLGIYRSALPVGTVIVQTTKHSDLENLKHAIEVAPLSTKKRPIVNEIPKLTDAQIQTLRLLAEGKSNSEIAKIRFVSEKSVEQMLARIASLYGITFDHKQNSRVKLLNNFYALIYGRR